MNRNRIGAAGSGAATPGPKGGGEGGAPNGRMSMFGGTAFRLVRTPTALQTAQASASFEKQAPLRALAGAGAQRQAVRDVQRAARPAASAATASVHSADPAGNASDIDEARPAGVHGDEDDEASSQAPAAGLGAGMAKGRGSFAAAAPSDNDTPRGPAQYRVVAKQQDRQQAQDQFFMRSGLPGAELLLATTEPKATRPPLRLMLATALRTAADLLPKSDHLPSPQAAQMAAVRAYLRIAPGDEAALNLGGVKQLLTEVCAQIPPRSSEGTAEGERRSDLLLLLPLLLLNAERPRTKEQRLVAADRLGLLRTSRALF
jgi:hypothetical protein